MSHYRRILVAIQDSDHKNQRAVAKAAQLALASHARLELFYPMYAPIYTDPLLYEPRALAQSEQAVKDRHLELLEKLAAPLRKQGLRVICTAGWDYPATHAIVRQAVKSRSDLVVVDGRATHPGRWLLRYTDWELLRLCPTPVLLVKSSEPYEKPRVLAAIDPTHAAAKPARLDAAILAAAGGLSRALAADLDVVHAYVPAPVGLAPERLTRPGALERLQKRLHLRAGRAVSAELKSARLPKARQHLLGAHPVDAIPATARKTRADIVVMGAISQSGLSRVFLGNTAEKVLDALHCDLLIVKPPGFARRVPEETSGPNLRPMMPPPYVV